MTETFLRTAYGKIPESELRLLPITGASIHSKSYAHALEGCLSNLHRNGISVVNFNSTNYFLNFQVKTATVPRQMSPSLAYFIGYFFGDGGLKDINKSFKISGHRAYKIKIADEFLLQIKRIQSLYAAIFGAETPIRLERLEKGETTYYIEPSSKIVYLFLTNVFDLPAGKKGSDLKVPRVISSSHVEIKQWFLRGLFDADGDTRAVEGGFKSQARIKLRMKPIGFLSEVKTMLEEAFSVSVNGPYLDTNGNSGCIQIERQSDIALLHKEMIFTHPIKRWRLAKTHNHLLSHSKCLKVFA